MKGGCCPEGSWPALNVNYKGEGQILEIGGTSVYHIGSGDRVLILFSDIFGASSGRHRNVADTYSSFGYNVYLPQILIQPYTEEFDMPKIIQKVKEQNWEMMEARFKALHEHLTEKGYKNLFGVGFCWGVWAAFRLAIRYEGFIAFCGMHPSLGICGLFGEETEAQLVKALKCPAYFMPAGNDPPNVKQGGQLVEILKENFGQEKTGTTEFPDMTHGWVVRAQINGEKQHRDVELALKLSKDYFAKF